MSAGEPSSTRSSAMALLRDLLAREFEVAESALRPDARLADDLDLDSLDVTELLHLIEARTEREIADDQLRGIVTLADVVDLVVASADGGPATDSTAIC